MKPLPINPGDRFHKLVAVERVESAKHKQRRWLFQCDCGGKTITTVSKVTTGYTKSCGCKAITKMKDPATGLWVRDPSKPDWMYLAKERWTEYYSDGCSLELFVELSQKPCHYCGVSFSNTRKNKSVTFRYNGLDRIDSSRDHSPDNIVSCCKRCNTAKMDITYQEFIEWLRRVHSHLGL